MAQNITLLGASYTDVPAVELPKTGGGTATFTDTTPTTASASDVSQGKYFFTASGVLTLGTATGGSGAISVVDTPDTHGGTIRTITAIDISDTTAVASDVAQGKYFYTADGTKTAGTSSGGGGSSWTLLFSKDVEFSTESTSSSLVYNCGIGKSYDPSKILWISIRDTQGKRSGYYYGSDSIYIAIDTSVSSGNKYVFVRSVGTNSGLWQASTNHAYGGLYPVSNLTNNSISIYGKYSSAYATGTIDSTYRINIYELDYPSGITSLITT